VVLYKCVRYLVEERENEEVDVVVVVEVLRLDLIGFIKPYSGPPNILVAAQNK